MEPKPGSPWFWFKCAPPPRSNDSQRVQYLKYIPDMRVEGEVSV
jgi:hypothetical protein